MASSSQSVGPQSQQSSGGGIQQGDSQPVMTFRQKRRATQALRPGRKRGPTRGLKSLRDREKNPNLKPFAKITEDMERVVGTNANRFIDECSKWVKEFCPLDSRNWTQMDEDAKIRLFDKIKAQWNLPTEAEGIDVDHALELQCQMLFRYWRYRLKELHFTGYTITQAINNKPPEVDKDKWDWLVNHWADPKQRRISEKNRSNRLLQKIKPSNGAKSTARYYHDEILPTLFQPQDSTQTSTQASTQDPTQACNQQVEQDPPYVRLWEKTKRHRDGTWDPEAKVKYDEFKNLHAKQVEEHGVDNLSVKEAYLEVLKEKPGYLRGLGPGPRPPKKGRDGGKSEIDRVQFSAEIDQLKQKEVVLQGEMEELKSANSELKAEMERLKQEAIERENRLKQEAIERENKLKQEAILREKKQKQRAKEREKKLKQEVLEREKTFREEVMKMMLGHQQPAGHSMPGGAAAAGGSGSNSVSVV